MKVLAFDTADEFCTLVLAEGGKRVDHRSVKSGREQAKILAPLTQEFLGKHQLAVSGIDRLAICIGPGSFTGLRVGMAFARGLSLAANKPLYGFDHFICTQEALRRAGSAVNPVLVLRASGRDELFAREAGPGFSQSKPFLATSGMLAEILDEAEVPFFTGNGGTALLADYPEFLADEIKIQPEEIAFSAALLAEKEKNLLPPPLPLYLREADVTFPHAS
ncbi:MAG: tRNA (adenosine(37)-N6)-threonylcarbamoyltransferase complex dimerization subunit type 1 TsaB [Proteobacteria bacterium]|nr:tRNA (adenosine(37)-N6)-threonylcarbamoyltransferase complex dimerization subunit type 1 TsaB [Pseudomonadota bacterium]